MNCLGWWWVACCCFFFLRMSGLVLEPDKLSLRLRAAARSIPCIQQHFLEMKLLTDKKRCDIHQMIGIRRKTKIGN